jgi:hypothetical protein
MRNETSAHKKLTSDLKSGRYFSGAGFEVVVYKGATDNSRDPDYTVQISSPDLAEALMQLLITANKDSIEITRMRAKTVAELCQEALELYEEISKDISKEKK